MDRLANPDLGDGIPARLFFDADPATRRWLVEEARRQRAMERATETEHTRTLRETAQRFVAGPATPAPDHPRGQLLHLQSLLHELAAVVGGVAAQLPDSNPGADAPQ